MIRSVLRTVYQLVTANNIGNEKRLKQPIMYQKQREVRNISALRPELPNRKKRETLRGNRMAEI